MTHAEINRTIKGASVIALLFPGFVPAVFRRSGAAVLLFLLALAAWLFLSWRWAVGAHVVSAVDSMVWISMLCAREPRVWQDA